jgi:hypothetical protein
MTSGNSKNLKYLHSDYICQASLITTQGGRYPTLEIRKLRDALTYSRSSSYEMAGLVSLSLSLCVCVCVCVCLHAPPCLSFSGVLVL